MDSHAPASSFRRVRRESRWGMVAHMESRMEHAMAVPEVRTLVRPSLIAVWWSPMHKGVCVYVCMCVCVCVCLFSSSIGITSIKFWAYPFPWLVGLGYPIHTLIWRYVCPIRLMLCFPICFHPVHFLAAVRCLFVCIHM